MMTEFQVPFKWNSIST